MGGSNPLTSMPEQSGRFRLFRFDALESTQLEAGKAIYQAGDVISAVIQTGGYGRRGRAWQGPVGNLYFTMVEHFSGMGQLEYFPYVVGLALYDAVADHLSNGHELRVKWPNDVLVNGKKMSGILIEVKDNTLLIGIGVNVMVKPETDQPVTFINEYADPKMTAAQVLSAFLYHYDLWMERAEKGGFTAIKGDWMARAAFIGEPISARLANGQVLNGIFDALDDHGALVLRGETAHHVITSADIFFNNSNK